MIKSLGSLLLGIIASLLASIIFVMYQTSEAELARSKAVKKSLVSIVEEHILNEKNIELPRISRLITFKAKEDNLSVEPTVSEIIENAEFNILSSNHLDFKRKEELKRIFDSAYPEKNDPKDKELSKNKKEIKHFEAMQKVLQNPKNLLSVTFYGLIILILLWIIKKVKSPYKRNPMLIEIEEWLKSTNKDYQRYFLVDFPKKYREYKDWKEKCGGYKK